MGKYFGTDGIRGIANKFLTPEFVCRVAVGFGNYLLEGNLIRPKVIVGYDTRISGQMVESSFVAGVLSMGIDVIRVGIIPTPGVAYLTRFYKADAGIMITASHNSYYYNGIKIFDNSGYKITEDIESKIEMEIENTNNKIVRNSIGKLLNYENDGLHNYARYLKSTGAYDFSGLKIVMDCANGASYNIAPGLFEELGAKVVVINNNPSGTNINHECGAIDTRNLRLEVLRNSANLGIAFDGDADRLIAVDELGDEVDGDYILYICASHMKSAKILRDNPVVTTVMSNIALKNSLKKIGIEIIQAPVGDKNVMVEMRKRGSLLGGEPSGHLIFSKFSTTGDGMLAALQLISITQNEGCTLSKSRNMMKKYPQILNNIDCSIEWDFTSKVIRTIEKIQLQLSNNGRVLVRKSGSEPLIRVMVECEDEEKTISYANELCRVIKWEIERI